jgi:ribosomal protein S18 acetylase RimI-like enzyme
MEPFAREAHPEDAEGMATVHVRSWRTAYRGLVPDEFLDGLSVSDRAASWRQQLVGGSGEQHTFVVDADGAVVGFASAGPSRDPFANPGTGEVYAIYVDPDAWGRGIGSTLLVRSTEHLRARGYTSATLWVLSTNEMGRRFYERHGWKLEGARQTYPIGGVELEEIRYLMEL